jgi:hypothetical protein
LDGWDRETGVDIGTLAFLPLDLLDKRALGGMARRLYRHEAESVTWCLIYICICMSKDGRGKISTLNPHPLPSWFISLGHCYSSKIGLANNGLLDQFPLHRKIKPLVAHLRHCWRTRYFEQSLAGLSAEVGRGTVLKGLQARVLVSRDKGAVQATKPYEELSHHQWFKRVYQLIIDTSGVIP